MKRPCSSLRSLRRSVWLRATVQVAAAMIVVPPLAWRAPSSSERLTSVPPSCVVEGLSTERSQYRSPSTPRAFQASRVARRKIRGTRLDQRPPWSVALRSSSSSFYDDFEKFDDDNDDDDEEDEDEDDEEDEDEPTFNGASLAAFRSKMDFLFDDADSTGSSGPSEVDELISYARSRQAEAGPTEEETTWARVATSVEEGVVLIANPAKFCADLGRAAPSPTQLSKFGLTMPPPPELGPDRRADLLPVLIVVEAVKPRDGGGDGGDGNGKSSNNDNKNQRNRGVLLNRRTGYLLGDLEQPGSALDGTDGDGDDDDEKGDNSSPPAPRPLLEKFCIQPLWFGGVDSVSSGLDMLHQCPSVIGCRMLTGDGLYWGGDPSQAQTAMEEITDKVLTGFDFKFFVQSTVWPPGELEKQIDGEVWFLATVSKEVLFKPRDRMGTRRAKPLWTECMELLGGKYEEIRDRLYAAKS